MNELRRTLQKRIKDKKAVVGVVGLGYVGLPLVKAFLKKGFAVTGFDIDRRKVDMLNRGKSYIKHITAAELRPFLSTRRFAATTEFARLRDVDAVLICVPTPLDDHRNPDLSFVLNTTETIARHLRKGQLVVLESTTYPGTTDEEMLPILERGGLKAGRDFFLAFSPERENPGDPVYTAENTPKVVGGLTGDCLALADTLYSQVVVKTVPVSSTRVAESTKLLENIFRSVNIALVNELKMIFDRMGIDVWEVIRAASSKPFGFMPFYPGPGLGGHCIPIDPFYLTWKAREVDYSTKFIELAGEINPAPDPKFEFGRNWQGFLSVLDDQRIQEAEKSLTGMLGVPSLQEMRFLDIGSGSGLFSLAVRRRGANVHSFDYDKLSVECTRELKRRCFPDDP
jgi:UDP-N-acetyl-D-glucosamine dehydrogenase